MSNITVDNNGKSVIKGLESVTIVNNSEAKTTKKVEAKNAKRVESSSIREIYVEKYNCILRYEGSRILLMPSKGEKQILLGEMTEKGLDRNVHLAVNTQVMDLILIANRKFSPVSNTEQEEKRVKRINEARQSIASLF